jgi:aquaporin Z
MVIPKLEFKLFASEAIGMALLLFFGISIVIFNWGEGSVVAKWIPSPTIRTILTGFLFGSVGCLIALSPVGKVSGAHINPAVSLAFWLRGKMNTVTMIGYIISQMVGAILGCLPLLLWGQQGRSIQYGITQPGEAGVGFAFVCEVFATACLILYLYIFIGTKYLRNYTPYGIPLLYSFLNPFVAAYSGDSTNPARSFGPAVITGNFNYYWLYWAAPVTGVLLITAYFRWLRLVRHYRIESARISYFESKTPESLKTGELSEDPVKVPEESFSR